jgi:mono/diheme cytochrome c family protein
MTIITARSGRLLAAALALAVAGCGAVDSRQAIPAGPAPDQTRLEAVERGRAFATTACAGCHAIGRDDASPLAAAPPLRDIVARRDPETLADGFAEGLVTSHPAMPAYIFRASEIDDLMAWLETLDRDGPPPR